MTDVDGSPAAAGTWQIETPGQLPELGALLEMLQHSEIYLGGYTDEELSVVASYEDGSGDEPLVAYPFVELLDDPVTRTTVQAAALRSLVARRLLIPDEEPLTFQAVGALGTVLALRSAPSSVLVVERVSEQAPARWVVYGVRTDEGNVVLEEAVAPFGHHDFVVRSVDAEAQVLAQVLQEGLDAEPSGLAADATNLQAVLDSLTSVVRLYALALEDSGDDEEDLEFLEIEAAVIAGESGTPAMLIYQPGDADEGEHLLWPSADKLTLPELLSALMRFDLSAVEAALAE
jgi:hypothetical protein